MLLGGAEIMLITSILWVGQNDVPDDRAMTDDRRTYAIRRM